MEGQHVYLVKITCADGRKMAPGTDLVLLAPKLQLMLQHYWTHLLLSLCYSTTGHTFFSAYVIAILDTPSFQLML